MNDQNGQAPTLPTAVVVFDPEKQEVGIKTANFKNLDLVAGVLRMAAEKVEFQAKIVRTQQMAQQQAEAVQTQALKRELKL